MNSLRSYKQKLSRVSRLWDQGDFDAAFAEVDKLREAWPGNAHLHVLWGSLVQLQEHPMHSLDDARQALQHAVELDGAASAIELGHFLDNVDDDPQAALKAYAEGVSAARQLLIEGLIGQAKALHQLGKKEQFIHCLLEVLQLTRFEAGSKRGKADEPGPDIIFESPPGRFHAVQLKGPYAHQIQELLSGVNGNRAG